jgi:hypothetical protein
MSCSRQEKESYSINEIYINIKPFIDLKKEIDYTNRFALKNIAGERVLINLSKSKKLLLFYLDKGIVKTIETNLQGKEIDAIKYNAEDCDLIIDKILCKFNYKKKSLDSIQQVPFSVNEFIIHNLYSENLYKYNDLYYLQVGNENSYNRLSTYALLAFNKATSFKFIKTPRGLQKEYIHYNDICVDNIYDNFYYTYATYHQIHQANIKNRRDTSIPIPGSTFISFDTTKFHDMKYIYDYTYQTTYNVKLLASKNSVYLIQRHQKNKNFVFKIYHFNNDLQFISDFTVKHSVDPNFIFFLNEKLIFISLKDKKIYEYQSY